MAPDEHVFRCLVRFDVVTVQDAWNLSGDLHQLGFQLGRRKLDGVHRLHVFGERLEEIGRAHV